MSFRLDPGLWKRVPQKCTEKNCNKVTHNKPNSKEGLRCCDHAHLGDVHARQVTHLNFNPSDAKYIDGMKELRKLANTPDELLDMTAHCMYTCQGTCFEVWKT